MDALAQSQIELNKKYGNRLIVIAWIIEIIAASLGLFIGIVNALATMDYYNGLQDDVIIGTTFSNVVIAGAPFLIIAAVELTKIPLALGFYRTKKFIWRLLFLSTLMLLVFVTFETMFNGLERQFSGLESGITESRNKYQEKVSQINSINQNISEINKRTQEDIDSDYGIKINLATTESSNKIRDLTSSKNDEVKSYRDDIKRINDGIITAADAGGTQQKVDRIRSDIKNKELETSNLIKVETDTANQKINDLNIAIQNIETNLTAELLDAGLLGKGAMRTEARNKTEAINNEKLAIIERQEKNIDAIKSDSKIYLAERREQLEIAEESLSNSQSRDSGRIDENLKATYKQIDTANEYWNGLIADENEYIDKRILALQKERDETKELQKNREIRIPELEERRLQIRDEIIKIRTQIDDKASQINVYRIAEKIFTKQEDGAPIESAADLSKKQISWVQYIWFGSIALVASLVGTILALAGFVLEDPEQYKPILNKKRPFRNALRGLLIRLRKFYRNRRTGVLRTTIRSLLVDIRRWVRAPRIKYQKVKVPHEVIKEVPGPEKIVYTEVPKEVVKNEIVYVPLYSVEEGTVVKEKNMKPKNEKDE